MTLTPAQRKLVLTVHVVTSVGLLGAIAAFLALAVLGVSTADEQTQRGVYAAMALIARAVILPLAFAALLVGLVQGLATPWGLLRHYWVLLKLLLTSFATAILLIKMRMIGDAARLASDLTVSRADLNSLGVQLLVHAAGGLAVLLVPAVLSIYKPAGLTPYGFRRQQALRARS
ncbi:hypothetical protein [Phenylobacterium aquaticum]|uniref:hypothetical protein n=1 Tax=Phenylobacterium aquaticum TaxID=1763816 RepID=UPI001F5DBAE9|nr:hypothetical protein [Phenylobacterium aquaticum]